MDRLFERFCDFHCLLVARMLTENDLNIQSATNSNRLDLYRMKVAISVRRIFIATQWFAIRAHTVFSKNTCTLGRSFFTVFKRFLINFLFFFFSSAPIPLVNQYLLERQRDTNKMEFKPNLRHMLFPYGLYNWRMENNKSPIFHSKSEPINFSCRINFKWTN